MSWPRPTIAWAASAPSCGPIAASFCADQHERAPGPQARRGRSMFSIDAPDAEGRYLREPADATTPERLFDRTWALNLLDEVLETARRRVCRGRQRSRCSTSSIHPRRDGPGAGLVCGPRQLARDDRGGGPAGRAAAPQAVSRRSSASGSPRRSTTPMIGHQRRDPRPVHGRSELIEKILDESRVWFRRRSVTRGQDDTTEPAGGPDHARETCPSCGAPLPAHAPGGHCPRCLLLAGPRLRSARGTGPGSNADARLRPAGRVGVSTTIGDVDRAASRACCSATRPGRRGALADRPAGCPKRLAIDALPDRWRDRSRRHGRRAEGPRSRPRPRRRDQGAAGRPPRQRRPGPPVRRGGADRRPVAASGRGADLRAGDVRRPAAVLQHEAGEGANAGRPAGGPSGPAARPAPVPVDLTRPIAQTMAYCPHTRRDPSRPEAVERDGGQLRRGPGDGLGPGQSLAARRCRR